MLLMAQSEKKPRGNRQVNIRFNETMVARLLKIGAPLGLDLTDVVRRAAEEYVQKHDPPPGRPEVTVRPAPRKPT
jgi:hypothetical protein